METPESVQTEPLAHTIPASQVLAIALFCGCLTFTYLFSRLHTTSPSSPLPVAAVSLAQVDTP